MSPIRRPAPPDVQRIRWHVVVDDDALRAAAFEQVIAAADAAIEARGGFHLVLAGGRTPCPLYRSLRDAQADWAAWHLYFGDERCLPPADVARNSRMAADAWLDHVPVPASQLHIIPAELGARRAAASYAQTLQDVGEFDLVLLGLGEDGHVASLFPRHDTGAGVGAPDALAVFDAPKPPPERVSLSAARLSRAREVLFLVAGDSRHDALTRWRAGEALPASAIRPAAGVDVVISTLDRGFNLLNAPIA